MTDKEQNKSEAHQEPTSKHITGMNSRGKDRRRFIKRAIVAAPFILTVTSRPLWAGNCTMSGQLSGNLSDANPACGGRGCSPGFWKNKGYNDNLWHYKFPPNKPFSEVFKVNPFYPDNPTLYQVIDKYVGPNDPFEPLVLVLGFHAVAALQNAATSVSFDLTVADVIFMVSNAYITYSNTSKTSKKKYILEQVIKPVKDNLDSLNNQGCPYE